MNNEWRYVGGDGKNECNEYTCRKTEACREEIVSVGIACGENDEEYEEQGVDARVGVQTVLRELFRFQLTECIGKGFQDAEAKDGYELGEGKGNLRIPYELLEKIRK